VFTKSRRTVTAFQFVILTVFLLCRQAAAYAQTGPGPDAAVTEGELEAFGVTVYGTAEAFPLDGLVTPEGGPFVFSRLNSRHVLLNLGATWCPYCGKEKPAIERFDGEKMMGDLVIVPVFVNEEAGTVKEYMEENGYHFPAAVDRSNALRERYAPRLPTSYLVDGRGRILARINGNKEWDTGEARRILRYLAGQTE
jgi:thiol-disulfide isomerase/thioredoxin